MGGANTQQASGKYPVIKASETGISDDWFKQNPNVAGMAWGGGLNGSPKDAPRSIVINPYTTNLQNEQSKQALIRNEAIRHQMDETGFKAKFGITPEQQKWAQSLGEYKNNPEMLKQTIVSRMATGDYVPNPTKEQIETAKQFR